MHFYPFMAYDTWLQAPKAPEFFLAHLFPKTPKITFLRSSFAKVMLICWSFWKWCLTFFLPGREKWCLYSGRWSGAYMAGGEYILCCIWRGLSEKPTFRVHLQSISEFLGTNWKWGAWKCKIPFFPSKRGVAKTCGAGGPENLWCRLYVYIHIYI